VPAQKAATVNTGYRETRQAMREANP